MARKPVAPIKSFEVTINGDKWKILLATKKEFKRVWPETTAVTEYAHKKGVRQITFHTGDRTRDSIAHELLHAYASYFDFSNMSYGAIEEKFCEVIGKKYRTFHRLVNKIARRLQR